MSDLRPQEIQAAINALAQVALGRKQLVWGGHPAITPLLWSAANAIGVQYADAVHLFQSRLFEEDFPAENKNFANVTYVDSVEGDHKKSLLAMRNMMLKSHEFDSAVFIGGMDGIFEEYRLFREHCPNATCIPLAHTGGATAELSAEMQYTPPPDLAPLDFVAQLHRGLSIRPSQIRNVHHSRLMALYSRMKYDAPMPETDTDSPSGELLGG